MERSQNLLPLNGECLLFENFFSPGESEKFFCSLQSEIAWRQVPIFIFGRKVMQPRLTAWQSDPGLSYSYSGITMEPEDWSEAMLSIKGRVEKELGESFNSALLNHYRNGADSVGWHRDNEKSLGQNPLIASLSFGQTRTFRLRPYGRKSPKVDIVLRSGSLLLMKGETQHFWEHCLPKSSKALEPRINITFRRVKPNF